MRRYDIAEHVCAKSSIVYELKLQMAGLMLFIIDLPVALYGLRDCAEYNLYRTWQNIYFLFPIWFSSFKWPFDDVDFISYAITFISIRNYVRVAFPPPPIFVYR